MRWIKDKPIIVIPIMLLLAFLVLPMFNQEGKPRIKQASVTAEKFPNTGFPDYDLLPNELKQRMEELVKEDTVNRYSFCYFFEIDDINHHYYLDDDENNSILTAQVVDNPEALAYIDDKILDTKFRSYEVAHHPNYQDFMTNRNFKKFYTLQVHYIYSEEEADFRQLRVGIIKHTNPFAFFPDLDSPDTHTYHLYEVDTPPTPKRGMEYFKKVVQKSLDEVLERQLAFFNYYDVKEMVKAEFPIGNKADSPQIIEGFSTRESDRDEAYKLDGIVVFALNDPKVRWKAAIKNGKPVDVRVGMTFYFEFDNKGNLAISMSDLYPATRIF